MTQERMTKIKEVKLEIYLIDQEAREVNLSQTQTKMVVLDYSVMVTIDSAILRVVLLWVLVYSLPYLHLILHGLISSDQIEQVQEVLQLEDPIQEIMKTKQKQICKDSL
jgi:hypothetical protein